MISQKIVLAAIALAICTQTVKSSVFSNPILVDKSEPCHSNNIDKNRFSLEVSEARQVSICQAIGEIEVRLNSYQWSPNLKSELIEIWKTFNQQEVFFAELPLNAAPEILAVAHSFPPGKTRNKFSCVIYLRRDVELRRFFYHAFFHELRHVYDFYAIWDTDSDISQFEVERRAFRLLSLIDEETPKKNRFSKTPALWRDEWKTLNAASREIMRERAILKFLKHSMHYNNLTAKEAGVEESSTSDKTNELERDL